MNYLSNAFSLQMVQAGATVYTRGIDHTFFSEAVKSGKSQLKSIIGHVDMANVLTEMLGFPVEQNRESIKLTPKDRLYVAQITGGRLPEGATTLPEGFEIEFICVHIEQNVEVKKTWAENSIYGAIEKRAIDLADEFDGEIKYMNDSFGNLHIEVFGRGIYASLHDG